MNKMAFISPKQKLSAVIFGLTLFLLSAANVSLAKDITLTWDANQESDVAFYNVYYKDMETQETWQESGPAHDPAASTISQQILGLDGTRQYCFQVTALNDSSIESSPSPEVCTVVAPVDSDSDGDGYTENQGDCNDSSFSINPGAEDICGDGIDQDCSNGDEVCPIDPNDVDNDGDNYTENQGDCNDINSSINPGAEDICGDGIDQDCSNGDEVCPVDPNDADGDGLLDSIDPQPFVYNTPLDNDTAFVRQVYLDFLNREPDTGGLTYWVDQLETGQFDRSELVEQYLLSDEFQGKVAPIARLYSAYFNRIPDYYGLMYWIGQYKDGTEFVSISDSFASSAEFTSTYGSLGNSEFVSLVYQNVLGRPADADGLAYWKGELDTSRATRGQVMIGFSESNENKASMVQEIYVNMTYIGLLRRSPDQSGYNYWVGLMENGTPGLGLIDRFLISDEYQARFTH